MKIPFAILINLTALLFSFNSFSQGNPLRLWYDLPADHWEACIPLGNGRLGAMPDGGIEKENITLNDITLWSGGVQDADKPDAFKYLHQIQQLLFEGRNIEAEKLMELHFICKGAGSGYGSGANVPYGSYQVLGNLSINYDYSIDSSDIHPQSYYRELSLDSALGLTKFSIDNILYTREYFTSFDDDVIVIKLSADLPHKINFTISINRPERFKTKVNNKQLEMSGQLNNGTDGKGMKYIARIAVKNEDGEIITREKSLQIKNANSAVIYISAGTNFKDSSYVSNSETILQKAFSKEYKTEKKNHIRNYQTLFNRAKLFIAGINKDNVPTDKRLSDFVSDKSDNGLPVLYYQFGRYLLISSTRPGLLPPNLQGLWANTIQTPWNGDYHLNINIQMNHFPLEEANLPMLNEPFFNLVKSLVKPGEKTARAYYNAKGWIAHVITNVWGYTSPGEGYSWGSYNTGSAWLCMMLWNHYEFTKDTAYLRKLYPIIKGSTEFYLSSLLKEPSHGWLVTAPSNSPENGFIMPDGKVAHVCDGPTIDNQILRALFTSTISACNILKRDIQFKLALEKARDQLPPDRIGKDGRLMEWLKEYKEAEPHHRHVSHLWGLYPGNEISIETPILAKAARASLEARGDDGTGWSLAWKINFWARLHDGNRAFKLLGQLLRPVEDTKVNMSSGGGTYSNLFCAHPPFQIDGNFGGTAGIAEMLLQSQNGFIEFLPALPDEWKTGSFSGWCVRGGAEVSAAWKDKKVYHAVLTAAADNHFKIKIPEYVTKLEVKKNGRLKLLKDVERFLNLNLHKGETVEISFI